MDHRGLDHTIRSRWTTALKYNKKEIQLVSRSLQYVSYEFTWQDISRWPPDGSTPLTEACHYIQWSLHLCFTGVTRIPLVGRVHRGKKVSFPAKILWRIAIWVNVSVLQVSHKEGEFFNFRRAHSVATNFGVRSKSLSYCLETKFYLHSWFPCRLGTPFSKSETKAAFTLRLTW